MFYEIHKDSIQALPFVMTSVGSIHQNPIDRPRGFHSHMFLWVTEGVGEFTVNGESFSLSKGEGIFLRNNTSYRYSGNRLYTAWFTFTLSHTALDHLGVPNWFCFSVPSFLKSEHDHLYQIAKGNSTVLSRSAAGYALMCELFSDLLAKNESLATRVDRFLEANYSVPLSLDEIAAAVGLDRFSLCHQYANERSSTVMNQLLYIRIENAKRMLKYSKDSVSHISALCGFENPCYFSKRFRQSVGCSPSVYRKR